MTTVIFSGDGPVVMTTMDEKSLPFGSGLVRDGKLHIGRWRQLCCHLAQAETPDQCVETINSYCAAFNLKHKLVVGMLRTYAPGLLPCE